MQHPTLKRAIKIAEACGSKAQTPKGIKKFFAESNFFTEQRKLTLIKRPDAEIYKIHKILDCGKKNDACKMSRDRIPNFRRFPFVDNKASFDSKQKAHKNNPRKKNLFCGEARISGPNFQEREESFTYRGSYKGYKGSNIYADYQSCICLSKSGKLAVIVTGNIIMRRILAPKGMKFGKDDNGIKLIRISDKMDYHPTYQDLRAKNFATIVREKMAQNYKLRLATRQAEKVQAKNKKESERIEKIFKKNLHNTMVTLEDSRKCGNCCEGSLAFCERKLKISREDIINGGYLFTLPAPKILASANGDTARAMAAVRQAWQRETTISI